MAVSNSLYKAWSKSGKVDTAIAKGYSIVNRRNGLDFAWYIAKNGEVISKPYKRYGMAETIMIKISALNK